ncbi:excalibur calcium-binding domain-containing protein [Massilia sp. Dwa41.01b]|nr:excalibur calcium-binding domain-containing protein [Massilia sp. Dwa41.01b]QNB00224.1 excalibur calcium-binding domain-containing protein [Massilia sp. Se16.2.3]
MKKIIVLVILAALAWSAYDRYQRNAEQRQIAQEHAVEVDDPDEDIRAIDFKHVSQPAFACDGRTHCSQMTSCDEAKYFVDHCPDVKMDGDHDGVPCEQQWCS